VIRQTKKSRAALAAGVVGLGLVLSACSPLTTDRPYAASDGVRAQAGDMTVENLMIVTAAEGEPGRLLGGASNSGAEAGELLLATADGGSSIGIPIDAAGTVNFFADGVATFFESVPVAPGSNLAMTITDPSGVTTPVSVPVLDGTLEEYRDVVDSIPSPEAS
jgi:hypothetical protein